MSWLKKLFCRHDFIWDGKHVHFILEGTKTYYVCTKCGKEKQVWLGKTGKK